MIWITRPPFLPEDRLITAIEKAGYKALIAPIATRISLKTQIPNMPKGSLILFTSQHGVETYQGSTDFHVFCVGPQTAKMARDKGFYSVFSPPAPHNFNHLLTHMAKHPKSQTIYHYGGVHEAVNYKQAFENHGFCYEKINLYEMKMKDSLPEKVTIALKNNDIEAVLLLSKRFQTHFLRLFPPFHEVKKKLVIITIKSQNLLKLDEWARYDIIELDEISPDAVIHSLKKGLAH